MPTPDPRPAGEMRDARKNVMLQFGSVRCNGAWPDSAMERALDAYRDAVAAEARAALLADAPAVWIGRDDEGAVVALDPASGTHEVLPDPFDALSWAMLPPGTVRRYALVPLPEEETP